MEIIMKVMMKFKNIYALIAVVLFATACQDDELVPSPNNKPAEIGDEIVFGGLCRYRPKDGRL